MNDRRSRRPSLVAAIDLAGRRYANQMRTFIEAIAAKLGLNGTDVWVIDLLHTHGPLTAGRLAELTGLTTGAVTGVVDRLERAGYAMRDVDPADRRRVVVTLVPNAYDSLAALFEPLRDAADGMSNGLGDDELDLIAKFLDRASPYLAAETARARSWEEPPGSSPPKSDGAAEYFLSGAKQGHLEMVSCLVTRIGTGPADDRLIRPRFTGPAPRIHVVGGYVGITYQRGRGMRSSEAELLLNPTIPWEIDIRGGSHRVEVRAVDGLRLNSFTLRGGAHDIDLALGRPQGSVPLRVTGGAHRITVRRPVDIPVAIELRGGLNTLEVDGHELGRVGGIVRWNSQGGGDDRYEIRMTGGANQLTVAPL